MRLAPIGAICILSTRSREDGIAEIRWDMGSGERKTTFEYYPFDRRQTDMGAGPTLLERTWHLLDSKMDVIMNQASHDNTDWQKARYEARGIAEVLAMFMVPHFSTADQIAEEAAKRYRAKIAGEDYETAGIGYRRQELPPGIRQETKDMVDRIMEPTKKAAAKKSGATGNQIPKDAVNNVLKGVTTGMFTVDQIASMYKMSASEVKSQLGIA